MNTSMVFYTKLWTFTEKILSTWNQVPYKCTGSIHYSA